MGTNNLLLVNLFFLPILCTDILFQIIDFTWSYPLLEYKQERFGLGAIHLVRTHLGGWVGSSLLYISIVYYMQKGGGWVQIACKIAYMVKSHEMDSLLNLFFQILMAF